LQRSCQAAEFAGRKKEPGLMTTISGVGRASGGGSVKKSANRSAAFAMQADPSESNAPAAKAGPTSPIALDAMLALQEAGSQTVQDREARRHGLELLKMLRALQRELLGGNASEAVLDRLSTLARSCPVATDPELASALQLVVLRARVELARRGR
jgi:Class II flagellar assembly regulator